MKRAAALKRRRVVESDEDSNELRRLAEHRQHYAVPSTLYSIG